MTRPLITLGLIVLLTGCTQLEEPVMDEPIATLDCDTGDGIGGTGCPAEAAASAVARQGTSHLTLRP